MAAVVSNPYSIISCITLNDRSPYWHQLFKLLYPILIHEFICYSVGSDGLRLYYFKADFHSAVLLAVPGDYLLFHQFNLQL